MFWPYDDVRNDVRPFFSMRLYSRKRASCITNDKHYVRTRHKNRKENNQ